MPEDVGPDIVVTGTRDIVITGTRYFQDLFQWPSAWIHTDVGGDGFRYDNGWDGDGFYGGGGITEPMPPDEAVITVRIAIDRPLTAPEQQALEHLLQQINKQTVAIDALPDNATLQLANGSLVTGAELKALWSRADFVLNENGHVYANGGILGESALNGGNPQISFNISTIVGYDNNPNGIAYVIAHELGHLTAAGQAANNARSPDNEMIANDVARAISNLEGITPMAGPGGGGYSSGVSDHFDIPTPTPEPTPGPAGGGGDGDDYNPHIGGGGGGRPTEYQSVGVGSWYQADIDQNSAAGDPGPVGNTYVEPLNVEIPVIC